MASTIDLGTGVVGRRDGQGRLSVSVSVDASNKVWMTRDTYLAVIANASAINRYFDVSPPKSATPATVAPTPASKPVATPAPVKAETPAPVTVTQQGITRTIATPKAATPAPTPATPKPASEGMSVKEKIAAWKAAKAGQPAPTPATPAPTPAPVIATSKPPRHVAVMECEHKGRRYGRTAEGNIFQFVVAKGKAPYTRDVTDERVLAKLVFGGDTPPVHIPPVAKPAPVVSPDEPTFVGELIDGDNLVHVYRKADGSYMVQSFNTASV